MNSALKVDRRVSEPLHMQVERSLRQLIAEPAYRSGEACLPDELSLCRRLGVSRGTVREAIKRLVAEGVLERRAGVGTRVVPGGAAGSGRVTTSLAAWPSFTGEMRSRGLTVVNHEATLRQVRPPQKVWGYLGVDKGAPVYRLDRVRGVGRGPAAWFRSWLSPRLGNLDALDPQGPLYAGLADLTGVQPATSDEWLRAASAGVAVSRRLGVEPGTPVLERKRVVRDAKGQCFEYAVNVYRGDAFTYCIRLENQG